MAKTGYINARVEKKLKVDAEKVLEQIGVSTSDLMTITFNQVVIQQGLPFEVRVPNKETLKAMAEADAGKGKRFATVDELFEDAIGKKKWAQMKEARRA